jgi:hypothetical protein
MNEGKHRTRTVIGTVLCTFAVLMLLGAVWTLYMTASTYNHLAQSRKERESERASITTEIRGLEARINELKANATSKSVLKYGDSCEESYAALPSMNRKIVITLAPAKESRAPNGEKMEIYYKMTRDDRRWTCWMDRATGQGIETELRGGAGSSDWHMTLYGSPENAPLSEYRRIGMALVLDLLKGDLESSQESDTDTEYEDKYDMKLYAQGTGMLLVPGLLLGWIGRRLRRKPVIKVG